MIGSLESTLNVRRDLIEGELSSIPAISWFQTPQNLIWTQVWPRKRLPISCSDEAAWKVARMSSRILFAS
jgi:hypothetical protein